ncbi:integrase catalytic domain-containing protein [Mycolicibacterium sp. XJ1819]
MTEEVAIRYHDSDNRGKTKILDELCAATGWHRDHARKALRGVLQPGVARKRAPRAPKYDGKAIEALVLCWKTLDMPAGKRLAPVLGDLVAVLRRCGELDVDDDTAALLAGMSAATIDRRLALERQKNRRVTRRGPTGPKVAARRRLAVRAGAGWDDRVPGFVELHLTSHHGGHLVGVHAHTLAVTDIATGWTEKRSVLGSTPKAMIDALDDIAKKMPFPIRGVDVQDGFGYLHDDLQNWCDNRDFTLIWSCLDNSTAEHRNQFACSVVGRHRYDTPAELIVLNEIWELRSQLTNYFYPRQKLVSKIRDGDRVSIKHDTAATPYRRAQRHEAVSPEDKAILADVYAGLNPVAIRRQIWALKRKLVTIATTRPDRPETQR